MCPALISPMSTESFVMSMPKVYAGIERTLTLLPVSINMIVNRTGSSCYVIVLDAKVITPVSSAIVSVLPETSALISIVIVVSALSSV